MKYEQIIAIFSELGSRMRALANSDDPVLGNAYLHNNWFTTDNVKLNLINWANALAENEVIAWLDTYDVKERDWKKVLGIVMAGNIPLVGFHDLLCGLAAGYRCKIKLSSSDEILMGWVIKEIGSISSELGDKIEAAERIEKVDRVIATGSNNTSRYFEYYFRDIPHVIRKNRTSIAILNGNESEEDLKGLGNDIFSFFGLGCRNVSKIYVPVGYDFEPLFNVFREHEDIINHNKYANNYTYHKSIFLMNITPHLDTGFLLMKEDEKLHAPLSSCFYQHYENIEDLVEKLKSVENDIQCVASNESIEGVVALGSTQKNSLKTYADNSDVMAFLTS